MEPTTLLPGANTTTLPRERLFSRSHDTLLRGRPLEDGPPRAETPARVSRPIEEVLIQGLTARTPIPTVSLRYLLVSELVGVPETELQL